MVDKTTGWLILIGLVSVVIGGYVLAWRGNRSFVRRGAACIVALLSALAGAVGLIGYAIPALKDFRNSEVSFGTAFLGNLLIWAISIGALVVATRFVNRALRSE